MKILVINDDGYRAPGIIALAKAMQKLGEVTVVAPMSQKTGTSHSINITQDLTVLKTDTDGILTYAVDSTPRDCAVLAIDKLLKEKPDVLVSGVNEGGNLGDDCIRSGTCGGASVGLDYGIPSIAVSLGWGDSYDYSFAAEIAAKSAEWFLKQPDNLDYILNVNVPNRNREDIKGYRVCHLGGRQYYRQEFSESFDGEFYHYTTNTVEISTSRIDTSDESDMQAFNDGYVTFTPLDIDICRHQSLATLRKNLEGFEL
ncbi:MAG: 5'/3'-nucleotidase SurE [Erysipelotrichaceae bacterium]|nr:5'/3'-nucleotidase SurE [Erysipelotrichaceae bacterium]